ncbi:hypothetical protein LFYK43_14480 [Ligilactobacillus salitolerans]|uniref:Uncharacterized protein n=1 Tax=Ligilactobacillus salitolerans TaxID=1808352 RepID=A0A401ITY6_9LACO|nr:hypothetical protein [Ligilactobacillus salitolerans]GBG94989.1 hypothetical protein LFYK43_14480 [Ligilactobacillus salitolerans]
MDIRYQAAGNVVYEMYMIQNIEKYLTRMVQDKLQDHTLRLRLFSYRQLKQTGNLDLLNEIEPLLNMRGTKIEVNYLYLLLYSAEEGSERVARFLDCAPFSEHGLSLMLQNPGIVFENSDEAFKVARDCIQATARLSMHFFNSDLALNQISTGLYRSFYTEENNTVTVILLTQEDVATDTKLIRKIAAVYQVKVIGGVQKDLHGKQYSVLRITKKLA